MAVPGKTVLTAPHAPQVRLTLRRLKVCVARHEHIEVFLGLSDDGALHASLEVNQGGAGQMVVQRGGLPFQQAVRDVVQFGQNGFGAVYIQSLATRACVGNRQDTANKQLKKG